MYFRIQTEKDYDVMIMADEMKERDTAQQKFSYLPGDRDLSRGLGGVGGF